MAEPGGPARPPADPDRFDELRRLVVGPERRELNELKRRVDDPTQRARDVSRVLPEAVGMHAGRESRLDKALAPIVNDAIRTSVRRDAKEFGNALFPVMGPAIRKAIAEAIRNMVQSFNAAVENSVSVRGLRWRLEAWRTGKPFGEVVLLRSLVFRVEQVFLIHRATGVQLQHVAAAAVAAQDPDLVAGMLTAIRDFVRDSFGGGSDEDTLDAFRVGELTVWVEHTGDLVLAAVIRGQAPETLRGVLRETLNEIESTMAGMLRSFSGDTAPFEFARPRLEDCLQAHYAKDEKRKQSPYVWVALGLVLVGIGLWLFFGLSASARWNRYLSRLRAEPGIVVTSVHRRGSVLHLEGLRDRLATEPDSVAVASGINPDKVRAEWKPFAAAHPEFVAARARRILDAPGSVTPAVTGTVLGLAGRAAHDWIVQARERARFVDNTDTLDLGALTDTRLESLAATVRAVEVRFPVGSSRPRGGQGELLARLVADTRRLAAAASEVGAVVQLELVGRSDETGEHERNVELSRERAEYLRLRLVAAGLDSALVRAVGAGEARPLERDTTAAARSRNRSVTVEVRAEGISLGEQ